MKNVVIVIVLLGVAGFVAVKFFGVKPPKLGRKDVPEMLGGKARKLTSKTKIFGIWTVTDEKRGQDIAITVEPDGISGGLGLDFLAECKDIVTSRAKVEGWKTITITPVVTTEKGKKKAGIYLMGRAGWDMYVEKGSRGDLKPYAKTAKWTFDK